MDNGKTGALIAESFPAWLMRRHGNAATQAGHLARIIAADPWFPREPTVALLLDWLDRYPFENGADYEQTVHVLKGLWETYQREVTR